MKITELYKAFIVNVMHVI